MCLQDDDSDPGLKAHRAHRNGLPAVIETKASRSSADSAYGRDQAVLEVVATSPCRVGQGLVRVVDIAHQLSVCLATGLAVTIGMVVPCTEQPGLSDNLGIGLDSYTEYLVVIGLSRFTHRSHCRAMHSSRHDLEMRQRADCTAYGPVEISSKPGLFPRLGVSSLVSCRAVMRANPVYLG